MDDDKGPLPINGFCIDKISRGGAENKAEILK